MDYHRYHYKIKYWGPTPDISMGGWGFNIILDEEYAKFMMALKMDFEHLKKFKARLSEGLSNIMKFTESYPRLQFHENSCLLTNISVPGNACGLDQFNCIDGNDFTYQPHNVDCENQASGLLYVFTEWMEVSEFLAIKEKGA